MGSKLLRVVCFLTICFCANPNLGLAQDPGGAVRYYFINFTFADGWGTDSLIYKIIKYSDKHLPEDGYPGSKNVYLTKQINPVDIQKAPLDSIKSGILNIFHVHNQFYSMVDRSQLDHIKNEYFFKNGSAQKRKYKFDNFHICGIPLVQQLKDLSKNSIEYSAKWVVLKFGDLTLKVKPGYFEKNKHKYFDSLLGIKSFDDNRLIIYP